MAAKTYIPRLGTGTSYYVFKIHTYYVKHTGCFLTVPSLKVSDFIVYLREDINEEKKRFLSGGLPMPKFFGPFSRSAFLVYRKSLFLLVGFTN